MATSKKAGPAKAEQQANALSVQGFNHKTVGDAFRAMSEKRQVVDAATGEMQDAAIVLCREAEAVATASLKAGLDADTIAAGWSAEVRAILPMLAKDGVTFVKPSEKKEGGHILTGYGQNVNSAARGFCQYPGELTVDGTAGEDGEVSISAIMKAVRERRAADATDAEKALRDAKDMLAEAIKAYRELALEGSDVDRITAFAEALTEVEVAEELTIVEDETEAEAEVDKAA